MIIAVIAALKSVLILTYFDDGGGDLQYPRTITDGDVRSDGGGGDDH